MTYLPDVNVWIAFAVGIHVHHSVAKRWFDEVVSDGLAFCRITELGMFRLLTNSKAMDGAPLSAGDAWGIRDQFGCDSRTLVIGEEAGFVKHWRQTAAAGRVGPNFWTDAYLISLCASAGCTLVTFDRALARQNRCEVTLLEAQ